MRQFSATTIVPDYLMKTLKDESDEKEKQDTEGKEVDKKQRSDEMAVLSDNDRIDSWAEFMRLNTEGIGISKADLRAAVNAADDWANSNAASFNSALPQPARGSLSSAQKARLLSLVVRKRYEKGA